MLLSEYSVSEIKSSTVALLTELLESLPLSKKVETMAYNAYVKKCCITLQEAGEYPIDQRLVYLVRLQACVQKLAHMLPPETFESTWSSNMPTVMFVNVLASDIRKLRETLSEESVKDRKPLPVKSLYSE